MKYATFGTMYATSAAGKWGKEGIAMNHVDIVRLAGAYVDFMRSMGYSDVDIAIVGDAIQKHVQLAERYDREAAQEQEELSPVFSRN